MSELVPIEHSRFRSAQREIFTVKVVADCMTHQCRLLKEHDALKLDACCQYGVDVDVGERDQILAHAGDVRAVLDAEVADQPWFETEEKVDADFPSGRYVRTRTHGGGCLFLSHDGRGCAIHRASIERGWDFHGVKPHVCRLFPLSYDERSIVLSDDYRDYSCSLDPAAPSVYRVGRPTLAAIFGDALVAALDAAEARVLDRPAGLTVLA